MASHVSPSWLASRAPGASGSAAGGAAATGSGSGDLRGSRAGTADNDSGDQRGAEERRIARAGDPPSLARCESPRRGEERHPPCAFADLIRASAAHEAKGVAAERLHSSTLAPALLLASTCPALLRRHRASATNRLLLEGRQGTQAGL